MLTAEEHRKACYVGTQVAHQRGYIVGGKGTVGREPTEQCAVLVFVAPASNHVEAATVHVVLEIIYKGNNRFLHTLDVHTGSAIVDGQLDCAACDYYHTYELYYEESEEDLEGRECEGGSYWDDGDGKSGFTPCTSTDTKWYESGFLLAGTAGWFCPSHFAQAYEDDVKAVKWAREHAERHKSAP